MHIHTQGPIQPKSILQIQETLATQLLKAQNEPLERIG